MKTYYPLSPIQKDFWVDSAVHGGKSEYYNILSVTKYDGRLDEKALQEAFRLLGVRYPVLCTSFKTDGEECFQYIDENKELTLTVESGTEEILLREKNYPFDLQKDSLLRGVLVHEKEGDAVIETASHLVVDGYSIYLLNETLIRYYHSLQKEPFEEVKRRAMEEREKDISFADYFRLAEKKDKQTAIEYWKQISPCEKGNHSSVAHRQEECSFSVEDGLYRKIQDFCLENLITLSMFMQGVWALLLQRTKGEEEVLFAYTTNGRKPFREIRRSVGVFFNILPMALTCVAEEKVSSFLQKIRTKQIENAKYEYLSTSDIFSVAGIGNPETLVNFMPIDDPFYFAEDKKFMVAQNSSHSQYLLEWYINCGEHFHCKFFYDPERYGKEEIERLKGRILTAMYSMTEGDKILSQVEILSEGEKEELRKINATDFAYDRNKTVLDRLAEQAKKTPEQTAVEFYKEKLTFRELEEKSEGVARFLQEKGIRKGDVVALCLPRCTEMIVAIFGVLKAGAVYLPLDKSYPKERFEYILQDSGAKCVLSLENLFECGKPIFTDWIQKGKAEKVPLSGEDFSYIIYTSGTSGTPKGVITRHRGLSNLLYSYEKIYDLSEKDIVLQVASYTFDQSVWDIFGVICKGGKLVLINGTDIYDPERIASYATEKGVTIASFTPAMIAELPPEKFPTLRILDTSGESAQASVLGKWLGRVKIINTYGPTEYSVNACSYEYKGKEENVPIGKPIFNTKFFVLGKGDTLCGKGMKGELCIAGDGLSAGYLHRPELTEKKFVPSVDGGKMYRTGDLVRWNEEGNIEFLERMDDQVKIRGFRIELGEIDACIRSQKGILDCYVGVFTFVKDKAITAYIVGSDEETVRKGLKSRLPKYMIPQYIVPIGRIPRTLAGKVDRKSLPLPERLTGASESVLLEGTKRKYPSTYMEHSFGNFYLETDERIIPREEVMQKALSLAYEIHKRVGKGKIIAVKCRRSEQMLYAVYAILFSGNAYMPIGTDYTEELSQYMILESQSPLLLCDKGNAVQGVDRIDLHAFSYDGKRYTEKDISPEDLAYVLFTSGSTGKPKGAKISHRAMMNRLFWMEQKYPLGEGKILQKTPYTFDVSVWEIFRPLFFGGGLVILEDKAHTDPSKIEKAIRKHGITQIHFVPSMYDIFLEYMEGREKTCLKDVFLSGESCKPSLVKRHFRWQPQVRLHNLYGPTECAVDVTYYDCKGNEKEIPIGFPVDNCVMKMVDERGILPPFSQGEIVIGGTPVGSGYLGSDQGGFKGGWYYTGDIGWYDREGKIYYLSRKDGQLKIGGQRIDLNGIEKVLEEVPWVSQTVVCKEEGRDVLVAYVKGARTDEMSLKEVCKRSLPPYAVPEIFHFVEEIPLTANGKVDRKALQRGTIDGKKESKKSKAIIRIIEEVIGIKGVYEEDVYEEIGGDSIKAIRIAGKAKEEGYAISVEEIMRSKTVGEIAEKAERCEVEDGRERKERFLKEKRTSSDYGATGLSEKGLEKILLQEGKEKVERIYRLTPLQEGMYFHSLMESDRPEYVTQSVTEIPFMEEKEIKEAVHLLGVRYEVLRTNFLSTDEGLFQVIRKDFLPECRYLYDVKPLEHAKKELERGFKLGKEPLMKIDFILFEERQYAVITMHHLLTDRWSEEIMINKLPELYQRLKKEDFDKLCGEMEEESLTNPRFEDYIHEIERKDKEEGLSYIREMTAGFKGGIYYPSLKAKRGESVKETDAVEIVVEKDERRKLEKVARENKTTISTLLVTVWGIVLGKVTGKNDALFGNVVSGRTGEKENWNETVGMFIGTVPVRVQFSEEKSFSEVLKNVDNSILRMQALSYIPLREAGTEIGTVTVIENVGEEHRKYKTIQVHDQTNYDIEVEVEFTQERIEITLRYNTAIYAVEEAKRLGEYIRYTLQKITECDPMMAEIDFLTPEEKEKFKAYAQENEVHEEKKERTFTLPQSKKSKAIIRIIEEVIGIKGIYEEEEYEEIGGDSIKAIRIAGKAKEEGYAISVEEIMRSKTVGEIAEKAERCETSADAEIGTIPYTPVFCDFFRKDYEKPERYRQDVLLRILFPVDGSTLGKSLQTLYERHGMLRAECDGKNIVVPSVEESKPLLFSELWIKEEEIEKICREIAQSMCWDKLFLTALLHTEKGDHIYVCIHHILIDGVSWRILLDELFNIYQAYRENKEPHLGTKTSSYKTLAEHCKKPIRYTLSDKRYIAMAEKIIGIPHESKERFTIKCAFSEEQTQAVLHNVGKNFGVDSDCIFLTALSRAVKKCFGQEEISVTFESHGRQSLFEGVDVTSTVGWFTALCPLLLQAKGGIKEDLRTNKESIQKAKECCVRVQFYPFSARPEILFNFMGDYDGGLPQGVRLEDLPENTENPEPEKLDIEGEIKDGVVRFSFICNGIERSTAENLMKAWQEEVSSILRLCALQKEKIFSPSDFSFPFGREEDFDELMQTAQGEIEEIAPLTPMQEGMFFRTLAYPNYKEYIEQEVIRFEKPFEEKRFLVALHTLCARYEALRTRFFLTKSGRMYQISFHTQPFWEIQSGDVHTIAQREAEKGFDLLKDFPVRTIVLPHADGFTLIWTSHHILWDAWCNDILLGDFQKLYDNPSSLPERKGTSFFAYARNLQDRDKEEEYRYWEKLLQGAKPTVIPALQTKKEPSDAVKNWRIEKKTLHGTDNNRLETALSMALQTLTGERDILYEKVISGRNVGISGIENTVGLFISTVPVRVQGSTYEEVMQEISAQSAVVDKTGVCSLSEIYRRLRMGKPTDILYVNNTFGGSRITNLVEERDVTEYGITFCVGAEEDALTVQITYDGAMYEEKIIESLYEWFLAFVRNPFAERKLQPTTARGQEEKTIRQPQTERDREILQTVRSVCEGIGFCDDFVKSGVSSLDRIRIAVRIPARFSLTVEDVARCNSVCELATLAEQKEYTCFIPSLFDKKEAIFLFPYAGATGRIYDSLVTVLSQRFDVYEAVGCTFFEEEKAVKEMERIAEKYKNVYLYTHCLGAVTALKLLSLCSINNVKRILFGAHIPDRFATFFGMPVNGFRGVPDSKILATLERGGLILPEEERRIVLDLFRRDVQKSSENEAYLVHNKVKCPLPAVLLLATEDKLTPAVDRAEKRWRKYLSGTVTVRKIKADHYFIANKEFIKTLKELLELS